MCIVHEGCDYLRHACKTPGLGLWDSRDVVGAHGSNNGIDCGVIVGSIQEGQALSSLLQQSSNMLGMALFETEHICGRHTSMQRVAACVASSEGIRSKMEGIGTMMLHTVVSVNSVPHCFGVTCKNLFCEQSGMLVTAVAGGLWTSENAGVLCREYVMALSIAQITRTNNTA